MQNRYEVRNRTPPVGRIHVGRDPDNSIRLFEILLANSFGIRDIGYQRRPTPAQVINYVNNSILDTENSPQVLIHHNQPTVPSVQNEQFPATSHLHRMLTKPQEPNLKVKCSTCGQSFFKQLYLNVHNLLHASSKFICVICGKSFPNNIDLNNHKLEHSKPSQSSTDEDYIDLNNDKPEHSNVKLKPSQSSTDENYIDLNNDKPEHSNVELKPSQSSTDENTPKTEALNDSVMIPFTCEICGKEFRTHKSFKRHRWTHAERDLYICASCGRTYRWKQNLQAHIKKRHSSG